MQTLRMRCHCMAFIVWPLLPGPGSPLDHQLDPHPITCTAAATPLTPPIVLSLIRQLWRTSVHDTACMLFVSPPLYLNLS